MFPPQQSLTGNLFLLCLRALTYVDGLVLDLVYDLLFPLGGILFFYVIPYLITCPWVGPPVLRRRRSDNPALSVSAPCEPDLSNLYRLSEAAGVFLTWTMHSQLTMDNIDRKQLCIYVVRPKKCNSFS